MDDFFNLEDYEDDNLQTNKDNEPLKQQVEAKPNNAETQQTEKKNLFKLSNEGLSESKDSPDKKLININFAAAEKIFQSNLIDLEHIKENTNPDVIENEIQQEKNLNDSFERKCKIDVDKKILSTVEKINPAEDDKIDIKEYDKITDLAITFPFELDVFQKRSVIRLEKHQNILVCAHTSSGKTMVAEYAIALGRKNEKRVFYTSPIKALSNQKYREFKKKFGDVGILTGDVSISPDAQCVIMTTEILQSSLYKNSDMLDKVDWVIFDEVHYINDNERGHVWEEILILLPPKIGIVMLSATIPNYLDFAKWVGRIKNTTIYIQNTLKRIVPLEHRIFLSAKKNYIVRDQNDRVNQENVFKSMKDLEEMNFGLEKSKTNKKNQLDRKDYEDKINKRIKDFYKESERKAKNDFNRNNNGNGYGNNNYNNSVVNNRNSLTYMKLEELVNYLFKNNLTPVVIFVFSIKKIQEYAKAISILTGDAGFVSRDESARIIRFFDKCTSILKKEDQDINQIKIMRRMLPLGIGVHHAGLLPIIKEIVEILYSKGLLKILFATTSFSIGLNMPTRTVVFTEIMKFNEDTKEILSSSEYLQMCGRAGRRGIDSIGNIFLMMGDKKNPPDPNDVINMLSGHGTQVESKFRLSYKTIISFLSRNVKNILEFFKESYLENNKGMILPEVMKKMNQLKDEIMTLGKIQCIYEDDENFIKHHYHFNSEIKSTRKKLYEIPLLKGKLTRGRIVCHEDTRFKRKLFALVVNYYPEFNSVWCLSSDNEEKLRIQYEKEFDKPVVTGPEAAFRDHGIHNGFYFNYFELNTANLIDILDISVKMDDKELITDKEGYFYLQKNHLDKYLNFIIQTKQKENLKPLDYLKHSKNEVTVFDLTQKKNAIEEKIIQNKCHNCHLKKEHLEQYTKRRKLEEEFETQNKILSEENLKYFKEFQIRLKMLRQLGFINENDQIELKGRAAREIVTTDCIIITQLLTSNILDGLNDAEMVSFLSGFAFNKSEIEFEDPQINKNFSKTIEKFKDIFESITKIELDNGFEENKYNRKITFCTSRAIYNWMNGAPFKNILEDSELEEGKLFNLIMRLYLFMDEIRNFYNTLGNTKLAERFLNARSSLIKDILSCKSLYTQEEIDIDNVD